MAGAFCKNRLILTGISDVLRNDLQQNGKNVVADVLSAEKTGGSLSKELGALPGQSSDLAFSRPVGAGANDFYMDREEKEIKMKKKILTLCMAMLLVTQLFPVAHAADKASTTVSVDFRASAVKSGDNIQEGENIKPSAPMKYDSIASALQDLQDGEFSLYNGKLVYVVSRTYPVTITITADQTVEQKVVLSAEDAEAESLDDGESLDVNFPEIVITTTKGSRTVNFSGGLEVQSGASLVLDNNLTDKKGASITYSFGAPVTVSGSLKFEGNSAQLGSSGGTEGSVNFTDGANLTVENGGEVTAASVAITGSDTTSPLLVVKEGGKLDFVTAGASSYGTIQTSGTAIQVDGGDVTIGAGKITSNNGSAVVANSGNVTVEKSGNKDVTTPEISSTGASSIAVGDGAELTVSGGKVTGNNGQPAIDAANGATVVIPEDSKAEIKSEGGNAAIDLAGGAKVQQGGNTITVAPVEDESASNYVDNHGNIVLESGSEDGKFDPNTVIQPDGTAISGKNDLPTVGDDGSVTLPSGGATITNPEGDKVEVDSDTEIPSIVIGVKDGTTGKVETSKRIELGDGTLTLETAVFDSEIDLKDYICTVKSDDETVAKAELKDGKIVVTPVSTGTAHIIATYTKNSGSAEGIALLDEGEATPDNTLTATFTVTVEKESSGGGSSGSSSDHERTYAIVTEDDGNGSVTVSADEASAGTRITVTVKPDAGYELDELTVTDAKNKDLKLTKRSETTYTFHMADSKVTVEASFTRDGEAEKPGSLFDDVSANAYYADAVKWAVEQGITSGTSATTFSPDMSCTRAQIVTFLWRANGSPKADGANPFTDVSADAYYYDAVLWAVKEGITSGTTAATFSPDATVTRGQTVTFLYRAAGAPAVTGGSFADVAADAYYAGAVAWAVKEGVTSGTSATTFSPDAPCTRGQIVTFLYQDAK